ncbi:aminomethyl transferase [Ophiocordyceps camponoti-floridani]|uniref:Iron-sulfur cluster assembly factor IBA57 homolog, mitochondrial n=1 Tax=Ophiocordyceps camponoti-floridani TaxID=2030778 RepID=A0A8H4Q4W8_9HYPO|nr:aminomethyl transferase [Ophiocordyceps camponoti-floridani]
MLWLVRRSHLLVRLPQRRWLSGQTMPPDPTPSRPGPLPEPARSGFTALASRRLLWMEGPDAAKFLQGLITANVYGVDGQPRRDAFYTGFLNATGRVLHDAFICPTSGPFQAGADGYLVEADAAHIAGLARYVRRYKLRARVEVRDLSPDEASVWHAWDDSGDGTVRCAAATSSGSIVFEDPRAPGLGHRIVKAGDASPTLLPLERRSEGAYTLRRILAGVPEGQDELVSAQALPLESNMDVMNGIDFRKGCYVGQELTIRTRHRGVVRKRILPCVVYHGTEPMELAYESVQPSDVPRDASIGRFGKKGRSAGKWLRGVGNVGLGLCRLEIMTDLVLPGEQAAATYRAGDEFVVEWGQGRSAKVKAFVPDWLRRALDEPRR